MPVYWFAFNENNSLVIWVFCPYVYGGYRNTKTERLLKVMKILHLDENVHVHLEECTNEELFSSLKSIHLQHYALPVRRCLVVHTAVTAVLLMTYPFQIDMSIFRFYSTSGFVMNPSVLWSSLLNVYHGFEHTP